MDHMPIGASAFRGKTVPLSLYRAQRDVMLKRMEAFRSGTDFEAEKQRLRGIIHQAPRIWVYGLNWLFENGKYDWNGNRLVLSSQNTDFGTKWSECGASTAVIGNALLKNGVKALFFPVQFTSSLRHFDGSIPVITEPYSLMHVVLMTDSGFMIDMTPFRYLSGDSDEISFLADHPFREDLITHLLDAGVPKIYVHPFDFSRIGTDIPCLGSMHGVRATTNMPLGMKHIGGWIFISSSVGINIENGPADTSRALFRMLTYSFQFIKEENRFGVLQFTDFVIDQPLNAFFGKQERMAAARRTNNTDRMLAFMRNEMNLLFRHSSDKDALARTGSRDLTADILARAKADLPCFLSFMSRIPRMPRS